MDDRLQTVQRGHEGGKLNTTGWQQRHSDRQATAVSQWDAKLCGSLAQILVCKCQKKDQHGKPGAVRKGEKKEANTVSCGASNKSFWSPDLAGQMAMSEG